MKTLTKLVLVILTLTTAVAARADWVQGHFRNNGTYVSPYYRTPANGIVYDNLSYRAYPSQQPGYVSPRSYGNSQSLPSLDFGLSRPRTLPYHNDLSLPTSLRPSGCDYFGYTSQR